MGQRHEPLLVESGRGEDAAVEAPQPAQLGGAEVGALVVAVVAHGGRRPRDRSLDAESHRVGRQLVACDHIVERAKSTLVDGLRCRERLLRAYLVNCSSGSHHQRVAVVGAEVRHASVGDSLHDIFATAERRQRQTAADALGKGHEVRGDAEPMRCARVSGCQARLDLVEDQQHTVVVTRRTHCSEITRVGQDDADVLQHRLHDDGCDLVSMGIEDVLEALDVVVGNDVDETGLDLERHDRAREAFRSRLRDIGLDRDGQGVVAAVVAALDLDDAVTVGEGARRADGIHRRLGPGVGEAQPFEAEALLEPLGDLGCRRRWRDEQGARRLEGLRDLLDDHRIQVTDEHRSEAHREVEQLAAIDISQPGPTRRSDRDRVWVPMLEGRGHAQRKRLARAHVVHGRCGGALDECLPLGSEERRHPIAVHGSGRGRDAAPGRGIIGRPRR